MRGNCLNRCGVLTTLLGLLLVGCSDSGAPAPPNFVILVADDLGWNDVGAYGNDDVLTPHIDQLARDGMRFTAAFLTTASCSASRASILTGKYPHSNGLVHLHQPLPDGQNLVSVYLREAGYFTAAAGKWHLGGEPAKQQFDRVLEARDDPGTDSWFQILSERPDGQPFFLWLGSRDPHRSHEAGAEFEALYDPASLRLPRGYVANAKVRAEWVRYYAEISRFDRDVGRVMEELRRQGVVDNTVVIVMTDNGRPFHRAKELLYDDGIKTPFIVYWPAGMGAPGDYAGLVSAIDIAPTLLDLAGVTVPADMQGRSFAPAFSDRDYPGREQIFAERNWHARDAHERAVRTTQYLYKENQFPLRGDCIDSGYGDTASLKALKRHYEQGKLQGPLADCFAATRPAVELFRVSATGTNWRNLAEDPQFAAVRAEMAESLRQWRQATGDFDFVPYEPDPATLPARTRPGSG